MSQGELLELVRLIDQGSDLSPEKQKYWIRQVTDLPFVLKNGELQQVPQAWRYWDNQTKQDWWNKYRPDLPDFEQISAWEPPKPTTVMIHGTSTDLPDNWRWMSTTEQKEWLDDTLWGGTGIDWALLAAGIVNFGWGSVRLAQGVPAVAAGSAAIIRVPIVGQVLGNLAFAWGSARTVAGGAKVSKGSGQLYVFGADPTCFTRCSGTEQVRRFWGSCEARVERCPLVGSDRLATLIELGLED